MCYYVITVCYYVNIDIIVIPTRCGHTIHHIMSHCLSGYVLSCNVVLVTMVMSCISTIHCTKQLTVLYINCQLVHNSSNSITYPY